MSAVSSTSRSPLRHKDSPQCKRSLIAWPRCIAGNRAALSGHKTDAAPALGIQIELLVFSDCGCRRSRGLGEMNFRSILGPNLPGRKNSESVPDQRGEVSMLDNRKCEVGSAVELNAEIRDILSLDDLDRGWEICGTLHVTYTDEDAKRANLLPQLEKRGVVIVWHKKQQVEPSVAA